MIFFNSLTCISCNKLATYFGSMKISPKDERIPSNNMTQMTRFPTEIMKITFEFPNLFYCPFFK